MTRPCPPRRHLRSRRPAGPAALALAVAGAALGCVTVPVQASTTTITATSQSAGEIPSILAAAARPAFTRRDRAFFVEQLALDAGQATRLDEFLAEYDAAFVAGLEGFRAAFRDSRPNAGEAATRYREEQVAMRRRMQQVLDTARAEAAEAADEAAAARIMREAEAELAELRRMLGERLAEFGPTSAEGRATVDARLLRMRELAADWAVDRERLGDRLLQQVRAMLTPEQQDRWPALDRALRRRTLSLGRLSGESVDLAELLEETVASAEIRGLAADALDRWARDLDAALRVRNAELPRLENQLRAIALEVQDDPDAADRLRSPAARRVGLHQTVRDITLAGLDAIAGTLPPDPAARLRAAFNRAAFPSIARQTPLERLIDAVRDDEALTDRESAELERLAEAYARDRAAADAVLRATTIETEPRELQNRIITPARFDQPTAPSPLSAAFRARRDLGARYAAAIRGLLGDDRFTALPAARAWIR